MTSSMENGYRLSKTTQELEATQLLFRRDDDIVLSYPEKPAPVISLDVQEDEERIMQADWGNESDDDDDDDEDKNSKTRKRLSTVEREEIEKKDIESKGIWIIHATDDGRPYYFNSITRQSAWEIPKTTNLTSVASPKATVIASATVTEATTTVNIPPTVSKNIATDTQPKSTRPSIKKNKDLDTKRDQVEIPKNVTASTNTNKANPKSIDQHMTHIRRRRSSRDCSRRPSRDNRHRLESSRLVVGGDTRRQTRSRSPPPPRDYSYDDYWYYRRTPSVPPPYRYHYNPFHDDRDAIFYDRYADIGRHSDIRYRRYDPSPLPPSVSASPPPSYYRFREHGWDRYEPYRSRSYR